MSVISDIRSKANNRPRHLAEFSAPPGVNPNGAQVYRSVANLPKLRRKQVQKKNKKELERRAEKALAALDREDRKLEKNAVKAALKQKVKHLWE